MKEYAKFCLRLHYVGVNNYLFVNSVKIYKFKAKDSEINAAPLSLVNVWKYFQIYNMKQKGLYRYVYDFTVDYDSIDDDDILYILKY